MVYLFGCLFPRGSLSQVDSLWIDDLFSLSNVYFGFFWFSETEIMKI